MIVDTGVALDIVALHRDKTLLDAMLSWTKGVVAEIAPPRPCGKYITMFVSHGVYSDYSAKLSGKSGTSHPSWRVLRKLQFTRPISRQDRLSFTIQSVNTDRVDTGDWDGDRFDRPFFALLEAVRQDRAWTDRMIIFASKDGDTRDRIRDLAALRDPDGRIHFADSLSAFEELVMC